MQKRALLRGGDQRERDPRDDERHHQRAATAPAQSYSSFSSGEHRPPRSSSVRGGADAGHDGHGDSLAASRYVADYRASAMRRRIVANERDDLAAEVYGWRGMRTRVRARVCCR